MMIIRALTTSIAFTLILCGCTEATATPVTPASVTQAAPTQPTTATRAATETAFKNTFLRIDHKILSMLYEPVEPGEKSQIAVLIMHIELDYLSHSAGSELAKRGYRVLCANIPIKEDRNRLDQKCLVLKAAVKYLRELPGVKKVILLGHSGGGNLVTVYQNAAENGVQALQGPEKIIKFPDIGKLFPADGLMLLDPNYGEGGLTLMSLDPAVTGEDSGNNLNPELDMFSPANGFNPEGSLYSDEFIRKIQQAQGERMNRLTAIALERWKAIQSGQGKYADDEPFIVPGGVMGKSNNRLYPQDIRLLSHTKKAWPLLHADGSVTTEVVKSVRLPQKGKASIDQFEYTNVTTVRNFLDRYAIRTTNYSYDEDSIQGVDWSSSYNSAAGTIMGVSVPFLTVGMTGGNEYLSCEIIYENAKKSKDKSISFVEGATHGFNTNKAAEKYPGQFGDTVKTLYDYVDKWLGQKGRFLD